MTKDPRPVVFVANSEELRDAIAAARRPCIIQLAPGCYTIGELTVLTVQPFITLRGASSRCAVRWRLYGLTLSDG
jgi:hypothetical protein